MGGEAVPGLVEGAARRLAARHVTAAHRRHFFIVKQIRFGLKEIRWSLEWANYLNPMVVQCLLSTCLLMSSLLMEFLPHRQQTQPCAGAAVLVFASMNASRASKSLKNFSPENWPLVK